MRAAGALSRGRPAAAGSAAQGGVRGARVEGVLGALAGLFGGHSTVNFAPVDGVFRAEADADTRKSELSPTQRVHGTGQSGAIRLYNGNARVLYAQASVLGALIDTHG